MNTPLTVTIPDAKEISGLSRNKIYEALNNGDLKACKAGRRTLIYYAELEAFVASLPAYSPDA